MTTRDVEWDDQERAWMLALAVHRSRLCPECGRPLSVCTDPASEGRWKVPPPTRCHASTAVAHAQEGYKKARYPGALLWSATQVDVATP